MGWSRFFRRGHWDAERAKELQDYLAHEIDDNIARGMTPDDARFAAHRKLGNVTQIREDIYAMNTLHFVETIWHDLRYGVRLIVRNPTFAAVAIVTLALGTGANAAVFQLVNAVRLRALPVERPQELVTIGINTNDKNRTGRFMSRRPFFSNESFATRYFPGTGPIGQAFQIEASPGEPQPSYLIVGLVKDTKYTHCAQDLTTSSTADVSGRVPARRPELGRVEVERVARLAPLKEVGAAPPHASIIVECCGSAV